MNAQPATRTIVVITDFQEDMARISISPSDSPLEQDIKKGREANNLSGMLKIAPQMRAYVDNMRAQGAQIVWALTVGDTENPYPKPFGQNCAENDVVLYKNSPSVYTEHRARFDMWRDSFESQGEKLNIMVCGLNSKKNVCPTAKDFFTNGYSDVTIIGTLTQVFGKKYGTDPNDLKLVEDVSNMRLEINQPKPVSLKIVGRAAKREVSRGNLRGLRSAYVSVQDLQNNTSNSGPILSWLSKEELAPALEINHG